MIMVLMVLMEALMMVVMVVKDLQVERKKTTPMVVEEEVEDPGVVMLVEVERLDKVRDGMLEKHLMEHLVVGQPLNQLVELQGRIL